jgi:hypothetical protein
MITIDIVSTQVPIKAKMGGITILKHTAATTHASHVSYAASAIYS